jgi:hypothetical protein
MKTLVPVVAAFALAIGRISAAHAAGDQLLPPIGGGGGGQFFARCQAGDILNGFELNTGDDVDAIRPICATPQSATVIGQRNLYSQKFGGDGGSPARLVCPDNAPLLQTLEIGYEGEKTLIVNNVRLYCTAVAVNQATPQYPSAMFDGRAIVEGSDALLAVSGSYIPLDFKRGICPPGQVAVGINGRSGIWLDAVNLICGDSPINPNNPPVKSIGRVNTGGPAQPLRPICDAARDARARNSPAAPGLEAQCRAYLASRAAAPVAVNSVAQLNTAGAIAAVRTPVQVGALPPPRPDQPALPQLDLEGMAARGAVLAQANALAAELRLRLAEGPTRRGFDIGSAAYENQQVPDKINGAAGQQLDAQTIGGFKLAQSFWLGWNRNVDLAVIGAWIASDDAYIARARGAEDDPFYKLGFDIATGIYGDRKHGARGNTATGPGAFAIRDLLQETAQRGFNASTALNLSRHY